MAQPDTFKETLSSLRSQMTDNYKNAKPKRFAGLLQLHGEIQVNLASGVTHSVHMGDRGLLTEDELIYEDRSGQLICLFWDQVESVWFHIGYID